MRRLIVFSDPGGAKPCLALAKDFRETEEIAVYSDRRYDFFENFAIPVGYCKGENAPTIFEKFRPEMLFTGTSYTSRIEMDFVREAAKRGVYSASFVDHYTGFDVRFGIGEGRILPNEIHVSDDKAAILAQEAGLPEQSIRIVGNPYHQYLRQWRSKLPGDKLFSMLGVPISKGRKILFAPDPLSNVGGAKKFGTDEVAILRLVLEALGQAGEIVQLFVKAHPNQSLEYIRSGLENPPKNVAVHLVLPDKDAVLNDLIQHVDLVAGMFSSLLLEAELLGAKTLRVLCGMNCADPLSGRSCGLMVSDQKALSNALR